MLQVGDKNLVLLVQNDIIAPLRPEVVTTTGQEIPGRNLVSGGIRSGEGGTVDGKFDKTRSDRSGRVVLDLDVLRNLNERSDRLTVELRNPGDDTLEALPEISSREGEIHDGVSEGDRVEDFPEGDISGID